MSLNPQVVHVVLYEGAGAEPLSSERRLTAISTLLERGYALTLTRDEITVPTSGNRTTVVLGQFGPSSPRPSPPERGEGEPATASDPRGDLALNLRFADVTALDASQIGDRIESVRA